jgi:hypothetical protein
LHHLAQVLFAKVEKTINRLKKPKLHNRKRVVAVFAVREITEKTKSLHL